MNRSDVTGRIARFVADTPAAAIPDAVRRSAVDAMVDTYATAVAGTAEPASEVILRTALEWAGAGKSRVLADPDRHVDPATAALVNGAAAHALDYDAVSVAASGFLGSAIGVALAAWVENAGPRRGDEVVTAYCLGWEAAAAIGRGVNMWHYAHGWHPTATLSHFAAALACSRIAGLDERRTRMAIGAAASEASGVKTMIGNMLNPFHLGKAARNGVNAVHLACNGFEASSDALESDQGFLNVFNGEGNYDAAVIAESPGAAWDLDAVIFKVYPCCALVHSALDAVLVLRDEQCLQPDDVKSVTIRVHEYVPRVMHVDVPNSGYAAKFSIPYCIAAALRDGRVDLATFEAVDARVVELSRRVRHEIHPALRGDAAFMTREFTEIELETDRGVFARRVDRMQNRGTGAHIRSDDLRAKLADCLRHGRSELDPGAEWDRLHALDSERPFDLWGAANRA